MLGQELILGQLSKIKEFLGIGKIPSADQFISVNREIHNARLRRALAMDRLIEQNAQHPEMANTVSDAIHHNHASKGPLLKDKTQDRTGA